jgi:hypothetical protein
VETTKQNPKLLGKIHHRHTWKTKPRHKPRFFRWQAILKERKANNQSQVNKKKEHF